MLYTKIILGSLLLASPLVSMAQSNNSMTLTNSSTVVSLCSLQVTENISFGSFDALNPVNSLGQGSVQVNCTYGSYYVTVGRGLNDYHNSYNSRDCGRWGCTYTIQCVRGMTNSDRTSRIPYELYSSSDPNSIVRLLGGTSSDGIFSPGKCDSSPTRSVVFANVIFKSSGAQTVTLYARTNVSEKNSLKPGIHTDAFTVSIVF